MAIFCSLFLLADKLIKYFYTFVIIACSCIRSAAQNECALIDSARYACMHRDTVTAMKYLVQYALSNPKSYGSVYACRAAGTWFLHNRQPEAAIQALKQSLVFEPRYQSSCISELRFFDTTAFKEDYISVKADICVGISEIYEGLGNKLLALRYLNMADSNYLPRFGCANGMIMYRTKLSLSFADYYLKSGDTTGAINRLLDFYMSGEAYDDKVAQKLKEVLHYKYTRQQITDEIARGIRKINLVPDPWGGMEHVCQMTIFGHKQTIRVDNIAECTARLKHEKNLLLLKS